jgi:hypothetical protein
MKVIVATYPCCGKPCRLRLTEGLPLQVVDRVHFCGPDEDTGTEYRISIRPVPSPAPGIELTEVEFLDLCDRAATELYGPARPPRRKRP